MKWNFKWCSQVCSNLFSLSEQNYSLSSVLWSVEISFYTEEYVKFTVQKISLDWIMRLSSLMKMKNNQKYNSILTVICYIMKYVLFIFIWNDITITDFTKLFFEHVECHFNSLRSIVMNRNSCIISDFWQEICKIQMIKQCFFTAYHLQMNDQSEALNQIIQNYLWTYTSEDQKVWAKLLSLTHFVYNNSHNHTTQMSLK